MALNPRGKASDAADLLDLAALEQRDDFISRHIGPDSGDITEMLETIGVDSLEALIAAAVPDQIRDSEPLDLPEARTEASVLAELSRMAGANRVMKSMIGTGYYETITPPVILRNVLENPGWYTAYTPYQPEISQGRLEALLNFQTMICDLTGMEIANASLLDEATAAAEAMAMCRRIGKLASGEGADGIFVDSGCHARTTEVLRTRAEPTGLRIVSGNALDGIDFDSLFAILLQYPATDGTVSDYRSIVEAAHAADVMVIVAADLLALTQITPPGEWGADVVVGSAQRFGVPIGFGGPHAAYMATADRHKRALPGRLVGVSVDSTGRSALRLALQTREQHIRRDKATSNICTAQVLLAVMAGLYAVYHGPKRLRIIGARVVRFTAALAAGLRNLGFEIVNDTFFDTLTVRISDGAEAVHERAAAAGINLRVCEDGVIGMSVDERTECGHLEAIWRAFADSDSVPEAAALVGETGPGLPAELLRTSSFMDHPVFNSYHSETAMLRYLRLLQQKDVALDRSMIPLGSCTMKLNATVEMLPITWPSFCDIHPDAPADQTAGYGELIEDLESVLCRITGFSAVSLQPNAGSQGEFAGLLAIHRYHTDRGEGGRDVCLIPSSAHGTNPASAAMAGMRVKVVACDENGNIDLDDLRLKAAESASELAALMVTYPSTHGVFEESITEICDIVHSHGGQVYMDGANMNALIAAARPGAFGPDILHLNLHKTFCIPHGGGGPGVGPVAAAAHLAPWLPGYGRNAAEALFPVAAAPWGSAGILPISWTYIALMGRDGLKRATEVAILSANYIARRLEGDYPILYRGAGGLVAHECIIDVRPFKNSAGVEVEDIAKRLIDYGFHAPTMSWPVAGTLMIEPTESEPLSEINRFCDAMAAIRDEIRRIEEGSWSREDNPLINAPHTVEDIAGEWSRSYSRAEAAWPVESLREDKYWPPVGRIDQVYGDRNLVCACPPPEAWQEAAD